MASYGSILGDIRSLLVGDPEDTSFDLDLMFAINTALNNLTDVGVGPKEGFQVTGDTQTWDSFLGNIENNDTNKRILLNRVKTYVELETRIIFDTPNSSYVLEALQKKADEAFVRANWTVDDQSGRPRED